MSDDRLSDAVETSVSVGSGTVVETGSTLSDARRATRVTRRPPDRLSHPKAVDVMNVLTIDLEEWFHVTNFEPYIRRGDWDHYPTRIQETLPRLLDILAEHDVRATFFTLGWVARRFPTLVRRIVDEGHEIASHGDEHRLVTQLSPNEFKRQLMDSRDAIAQASGCLPFGHRAPSYSFRKSTEWALDALLDCGFAYDSSVFPFGPRRDADFCDARFPCIFPDRGHGTLIEYPLSIVEIGKRNVPIAGGGYFRLLPYPVIWWGVHRLNHQGHPAIMYFHPWEIDPNQPRMHQASWLAKFRHYHNLSRTEDKLRRLLSDFRFGSIRDVYWSERTQQYDVVPQR